MTALTQSENFRKDYELLKLVSLNPERHSATSAFEHCELVADRVGELAALNVCSDEDREMLDTLARLHDIGKINGTSNPAESINLLERYGEVEDKLLYLVKYHDINLPWYIASKKGQTPSDKAWNKMLRKVDIKLLALFMVADRVDCPGGWSKNEALVWFLNEIERRGLLEHPLVIDAE